MTDQIETYLKNVHQYLSPLSQTTKDDIIHELRCSINERKQHEQISDAQILVQLGSEKSLAKSYLTNLIIETEHTSLSNIKLYFCFYSLAGIGGIFVFPFFAITSITCGICGVLTIIAGLIKLITSFFGNDVSFIGVEVGSYHASPLITFILSIIIGIILILLSKLLFHVTKAFVRILSRKKARLI